MRCYVCERKTPSRQRYCDRCRAFVFHYRDSMKRRIALREAYDRDLDGFRDHWSGVLLTGKDYDDPFYLCFDHLVPLRSSRLVASSSLFNSMKNELGPDEFRTAIHELAAHRAGRRFVRDCIEFRYWGLKAPTPSGRPSRGRFRKVVVSECVICGSPPIKWSYYCKRCLGFVMGYGGFQRLRAKALKEAWDPESGFFSCHFTGARLDETDPRSPWYLNFEHATPGNRGTLVVAAYWVNVMKTSLSESEFWSVILEYDRYLREGGEFDRDVAEFRWWRRTARHGP